MPTRLTEEHDIDAILAGSTHTALGRKKKAQMAGTALGYTSVFAVGFFAGLFATHLLGLLTIFISVAVVALIIFLAFKAFGASRKS